MDLKTWLTKQGMTQRDFATAIGVTESAVSHYLKGRIGPSRVLAVKIEEVTEGAVPADVWEGGASRAGQGAGIPKSVGAR